MNPGAIYDSLPEEARDMPRADFIRKVQQLTSPGLMQQALKVIISQKQETRTRQAMAEARAKRIEEALR